MSLNAGAMRLSHTLSRFWPHAEPGPAPAGTWSPDVDAVERRDTFMARIDLPGTPLSEIHVDISEDDVTVYGQRPADRHERGDTWSHAERAYGWFFRVLPLPVGAAAEAATAILRDGVLELRVPLTTLDAVSASAPNKTTVQVRRG